MPRMWTETAPLLTAAAALAAVLALIWAAGRVARIVGPARAWRRAAGGRTLAIEETLALDQRRRLLLVRCERGRFLLLTGGTDLVVGWLPETAGHEP